MEVNCVDKTEAEYQLIKQFLLCLYQLLFDNEEKPVGLSLLGVQHCNLSTTHTATNCSNIIIINKIIIMNE